MTGPELSVDGRRTLPRPSLSEGISMAQPALNFQRNRDRRDLLFEEIVDSLNVLPELLREVFVRSHYRSQSVSEIAGELQLPVSSVRDLQRDADEVFYRQLHRFRI